MTPARSDRPYRGRYAPSPTGPIHLGNARTALVAWLACRVAGGTFVYRLEDLDGPRVVDSMAEAQMADLRWLGLDWDEGPDVGGPHAPYVQSERFDRYEAALDQLQRSGRLFPCQVSRRELREIASAPHGASGLPPYPAALRPHHLAPDWYERFRTAPDPDAALRFIVADPPVSFVDRVHGSQTENVAEAVGDFVLKRRDGVYGYQLAVVVDDLAMQITEVVRGVDLLDSTARQIQLVEALGESAPAFAHVPLVLNADGEKVSKRDAEEGLAVDALRREGVRAEQIVGYLAFSLGLRPAATPLRPADLVDDLRWSALRPEPWTLPNDIEDVLRAV